MPAIGARCHELRINDRDRTWRVVYRIDADAIVLLDVFCKKTGPTPIATIATCRARAARYDRSSKESSHEGKKKEAPRGRRVASG
jgi:phage-related protein